MVHIGHNIIAGHRSFIAGSTILDDDVWVGLDCAISSELSINDRADITIGSVVTKDMPPEKE